MAGAVTRCPRYFECFLEWVYLDNDGRAACAMAGSSRYELAGAYQRPAASLGKQ